MMICKKKLNETNSMRVLAGKKPIGRRTSIKTWKKLPDKYFRTHIWINDNKTDKVTVYSGGQNFWWFTHERERPTQKGTYYNLYKRGAFHRKKDVMKIAIQYMEENQYPKY